VYSCVVCGQVFNSLARLKAHFKRYHAESLDRCPLCGYKPPSARRSTRMALIMHCVRRGDEKHLALLYLLYAQRTSIAVHKRRKISKCASTVFNNLKQV